ncbi:hypothetical protein HAX54_009175, partial [Datura stramonium]|nr:hypothetical protein [Datura stramonium]
MGLAKRVWPVWHCSTRAMAHAMPRVKDYLRYESWYDSLVIVMSHDRELKQHACSSEALEVRVMKRLN